MDASNLLISVTLHVFLLFVFLSILFWAVISPTETKSLTSELDKSINNINYEEQVQKEVKDYLLAVYDTKDITQKKNNSMLLLLNITIIVLLFIILGTQIIFHHLRSGTVEYGEIILENIIILVFVGIIEFLFFRNIASHYIPVKPSYMNDVIKQNIDNV